MFTLFRKYTTPFITVIKICLDELFPDNTYDVDLISIR